MRQRITHHYNCALKNTEAILACERGAKRLEYAHAHRISLTTEGKQGPAMLEQEMQLPPMGVSAYRPGSAEDIGRTHTEVIADAPLAFTDLNCC